MGRATAHQYARNGARAVYICDYQDSHLALHVEELHSLYPDVAVHARKFDAGDEEGVKGVVGDAMGSYGRLDVFFANAATSGTWKVCTEMEVGEFERTLRVNLIRYVELLFCCLSVSRAWLLCGMCDGLAFYSTGWASKCSWSIRDWIRMKKSVLSTF